MPRGLWDLVYLLIAVLLIVILLRALGVAV